MRTDRDIGREPVRGPVRWPRPAARPVVLWPCLACCVWAGIVHAGPEQLDGRYRADYQSQDSATMDLQRLQQQLDLRTADHLFGANALAVHFTAQRFSDLLRGEHGTSQRWRFQLTGTAYSLTGILAPRGRGLYGGATGGDETRDVQLLWTYRPTRLPVVTASYRRNEHFHGEATDPFSRATERTVQMTHRLGIVDLEGGWRDVKHRTGEATGRRDQRTWHARARANRSLGHGVRADVALDYLDTRTREGAAGLRDETTRNLRAGLAWTARRDLQATLHVMDRHTRSRADTAAAVTGLNRELAVRVTWRPDRSWQVDLRRDVRKVRQGASDTYSDVMRWQASWHGRLRSRLQGRLNVVKNVAIATRNLSVPSDDVDLTLESPVFRRTTLRATVLVSRRSGEVSSRLGRYSVQRTLDLRARLLRRLSGNLTWRGARDADSVDLTGVTTSGTTVGLVYAGTRGLTWSGTYRRSRDRRSGDRLAEAWNGNLDLRLGQRWSWTLSGSRSEATGDDAATDVVTSYYVRANYRIGPRTSCHVGWASNRREGSARVSSLTASYATVF